MKMATYSLSGILLLIANASPPWKHPSATDQESDAEDGSCAWKATRNQMEVGRCCTCPRRCLGLYTVCAAVIKNKIATDSASYLQHRRPFSMLLAPA